MAKETKSSETEATSKKCGIVMPIAAFDGHTATHWSDVKEIIQEAGEKAGFEPNLVSYADETSVIHKTIIFMTMKL